MPYPIEDPVLRGANVTPITLHCLQLMQQTGRNCENLDQQESDTLAADYNARKLNVPRLFNEETSNSLVMMFAKTSGLMLRYNSSVTLVLTSFKKEKISNTYDHTDDNRISSVSDMKKSKFITIPLTKKILDKAICHVGQLGGLESVEIKEYMTYDESRMNLGISFYLSILKLVIPDGTDCDKVKTFFKKQFDSVSDDDLKCKLKKR